jgi:hypothetical protein
MAAPPCREKQQPLNMFRDARRYCNDAAAMCEFLEGHSSLDVSRLVCYLVAFKGKRDDIANNANMRQKERLGVAPSYHYVQSNPQAKAKKMQRDKQWVAQKRAQEKAA